MNTRLLMTSSAVAMGALGAAASFLPQEILQRAGLASTGPAVLGVQVLGALYLGFAMLNWMARANLIGGIYGRPVAMGNLLHFTVAALALVKSAAAAPGRWETWTAAGVYSIFAAGFWLVVFRPARAASGES
jgi:hypothetical protein